MHMRMTIYKIYVSWRQTKGRDIIYIVIDRGSLQTTDYSMGFCLGFGRFLLIFVNVFFMIGAFVLAGVGAATIFVKGAFDYIIYGLSTMEKIEQALKDTGLGDEDSYSNLGLEQAFTTVAMAFVAMGALIVIVTMIGCCGGCCKSKCCLGLNATILTFLLVFEVLTVILLYSDESLIKTPLKQYSKKSVEGYKGFPGDNIQSFGWNFGMVKFNCCGVIDYEDFDKADKWEKTITTDNVTYNLKVPITCCFPLPTSTDLTCATTTDDNNADQGCFETLWDMSFGNRLISAIAYGAGFTLQVLLILFSLLICLNEPSKVSDQSLPDYKPRPPDEKTHPLQSKESNRIFYTSLKPKH